MKSSYSGLCVLSVVNFIMASMWRLRSRGLKLVNSFLIRTHCTKRPRIHLHRCPHSSYWVLPSWHTKIKTSFFHSVSKKKNVSVVVVAVVAFIFCLFVLWLLNLLMLLCEMHHFATLVNIIIQKFKWGLELLCKMMFKIEAFADLRHHQRLSNIFTLMYNDDHNDHTQRQYQWYQRRQQRVRAAIPETSTATS